MKVCQLCAVDFTLQKFLLPLVDGMEAEGWSVYSVCSNGSYVPELRKKGYNVITIPIYRSANPFKHILTLFRLIKLFKVEKFDVIHVHTPVASLVARLAAFLAGSKFVVYTAHGFYFHDDMPPWKRQLFIKIEKIAGLATSLLFTQSQEDAETAIKEKIFIENKVVAIGNGVDVNKYHPVNFKNENLRESLNIPNGAFVIGMISRLVKEKGVLEFLEAAIQVNKVNSNVYFLLIGDRLGSDHADGVNDVILESSNIMGEYLILTGVRNDIPDLLNIIDLYCLPSWREGMPRTIIEAMMMEKPVVATDIRGSREEVIPEHTGLLVPVRSVEKLANAFHRFINNKKWSLELGHNGRKRALKHYDERKVVSLQIKKISELFLELG